MSGKGVWLRGGGRKKSGGTHKFSLIPFKAQSLQIGVKNGKNIWTKLLPLLLTFFFSPVKLAFCFFVFFFFFFLWFCRS